MCYAARLKHEAARLQVEAEVLRMRLERWNRSRPPGS